MYKRLIVIFLTIIILGLTSNMAVAKPLLVISEYTINPNPIKPGNIFTLNLKIHNFGSSEAKNSLISLNLGELVAGVGESNAKYIGTIAADGEKVISYQLYSEGNTNGRALNIEAMLTFENNAGDDYSSSQVLGLLFIHKAETVQSPQKPDPIKPQLIISSYEVDPPQVSPGKKFTLTLAIKNMSNSGVKNLTLSLGDSAIPSSNNNGTTKITNTGAINTSTIVVMNDAGNSRYVGSIGAGQEKKISFDLIASPKVNAGAHDLNIALEYVSSKGISYTSSQAIGVKFFRPVSFVFQDLNYPKSVIVGKVFTVTANVINSSNFTVSGISFDVIANELRVMKGASVYVGSLDSDDSEILEAKAKASKTGIKIIKLVVKYHDDFNQERKIEKKIKIKVKTREQIVNKPVNNNKGGFFHGLIKLLKTLLGIG